MATNDTIMRRVTHQSDIGSYVAEVLRADPTLSRNKTLKFEGDQLTWNQARELVQNAVTAKPGVSSTFATTLTSVGELEKRLETAQGFESVSLQLILVAARGCRAMTIATLPSCKK
ncbi:hypothetical protein BJ741DRAFT_584554 [Chytriomyces cf. hyalinus JEL632]|nr:hypothetical protein BJ741DRAFT_584554 [Chytriomyces cf. hyalinus JEL632]